MATKPLRQNSPIGWMLDPFQVTLKTFPVDPKSNRQSKVSVYETTRGKFFDELAYLKKNRVYYDFEKTVFGLDKTVFATGYVRTAIQETRFELYAEPLKKPLKQAPKIKPALKARKGVVHG